MNRITFSLLCLLVAPGIPGCKIVETPPDGEQTTAADASGDDTRTESRMSETFESRLLPLVRETALPIATLRDRIGQDLDTAGSAHAHRGAGAGSAWNFTVRGSGVVVASKLDTRARTVDLDTDGDGTADAKIQLGPVIRGTALRDAAPFYSFDDFRDQIEFAKLGRAINDRIAGMIDVPEGELIGRTVGFVGVVPLKAANQPFVITPTEITVSP